jgi:hypothetical protein
MIRSGLPLAMLLLAACADAPPRAAVVIVPVSPPIAPASSAVPEAPPEAVASSQFRVVEIPEVSACVLTTARWRGAVEETALRVRAGGPVFATVLSGRASLHLPVGSATGGAVVEVADAALAVRGHVAASDVWLHPGKPFVLGDAVIPLGNARLDWTSSRPGGVSVAFDPEEGIALVQPPLTGDVPCDALSLDHDSFDESAALPGAAKGGKEGLLRAGRAAPLALTAGGAVIANLTAKPGVDARITVLGAAGVNTRIAWARENSAIFGWVPTAALDLSKDLSPRGGHGSGSGSGRLSGTHSLYRIACPTDVDAIVEVGGERWQVGRILAGTKIHVMSEQGDDHTVIVHGTGIVMAVDARLTASAAALSACSKVR